MHEVKKNVWDYFLVIGDWRGCLLLLEEAKMKLKIKGLHCKSCKVLLEDALGEIGVKAEVNVEAGLVEVEAGNVSLDKIKEIIESEGDYTVE